MEKHKLSVTMRNGATRRYIHDMADGRSAGVMLAEPGKRGWLWYLGDEDPYDWSPYHRVHTSIIETVENEGDDIVITTQNTIYRLVAVEE